MRNQKESTEKELTPKEKKQGAIGCLIFVIAIVIWLMPGGGDNETNKYSGDGIGAYMNLRNIVKSPTYAKTHFGHTEEEPYEGTFCKAKECVKYAWTDSHYAIYAKDGDDGKDRYLMFYTNFPASKQVFEYPLPSISVEGREPDHERSSLKAYYGVLGQFEVTATNNNPGGILLNIDYMLPKRRMYIHAQSKMNAWGEHSMSEVIIKDNMYFPDSYKHVRTSFEGNDDGESFNVTTIYKGKNQFGAMITNETTLQFDKEENLIRVVE